MKNKILILLFLFIIFFERYTYAKNEEVLKEQMDSFRISDFIDEAEKYSNSFFDDNTNISEVLNSAIIGKVDNSSIFKKVLNILSKETVDGLQVLSGILVIIIIHSILKTISDSLNNNNVSQIIYYIQYILIVTIMTANFADTIQMVKDTSDNLIGFMNCLIPLLISLMLFTGSIVTSSVVEPIILFMINLLGNCISLVLIPVVLIITVLSVISKISDKVQVEKLANILNSGVIWFLGISLTVFVATISLEGSLSSGVDGISAKTLKTAVSTVIPVVGKVLRRCC